MKEEYKRIIAAQSIWIETNFRQGKRANLRTTDLSGANLSGANLRIADLLIALREVDFRIS